jgi:hypothetical protein
LRANIAVMTDTPSERRLAENEVLFRELNEKVLAGVSETNRLAIEDNQPEFTITVPSAEDALQFFCECADEKCTQRVVLSFQEYQNIHKIRDQFVIVPGHQVGSIENVISEQPGYLIVKKKSEPPETSDKLNPTPLKNK